MAIVAETPLLLRSRKRQAHNITTRQFDWQPSSAVLRLTLLTPFPLCPLVRQAPSEPWLDLRLPALA
jgi:hypothetical protein